MPAVRLREVGEKGFDVWGVEVAGMSPIVIQATEAKEIDDPCQVKVDGGIGEMLAGGDIADARKQTHGPPSLSFPGHTLTFALRAREKQLLDKCWKQRG